jgi:hypothetical protein
LPTFLSYNADRIKINVFNGPGLENRDYGRIGSAALIPRHPSMRKTPLTSRISGGRSVGIVSSRTQATEFVVDGRKKQ